MLQVQEFSSKLKQNSKLIFAILGTIALGVVGFYGYKAFKGKPMAQMPMMEPEIDAVVLKLQDIPNSIELPGRVVSYEISEVRPQVSGVLKELKFQEGGFVKKDEPLYLIDDTLYVATYQKAKSAFDTANEKYLRYKKLLGWDAVSKQDYEDVFNAYNSAKSDLETAQTNLQYTNVLAPISGFVTKSNVTKGALLVANQPDAITTITGLQPIYVEAVMPRKELYKLKNQAEIPITLEFDGNATQKGVLQFSEVIVDMQTDSVILRSKFENTEGVLLPGMFAQSILHLQSEKGFLVPQRATFRTPDGTLNVYIIDKENKISPKPIKAQRTLLENWVVLEGLNEGDTILYDGIQKVRPGIKVKPIIK